MKYRMLQNIAEGQPLIPVVKHISQDKISRFGVVTGSTGPVHVDPSYCAASPLKTTLAHGFLTMAYLCEVMENNFGMAWNRSGVLDVKFVGAARPGDSLLVSGTVESVRHTDEGEVVACRINIVSQTGAVVLAGSTSVVLSEQG